VLGFGYGWSGNGSPREIWLDQDGGWEDVAALAILLRSPDVKVMGVATTPGIADAGTAKLRVGMMLDALREKRDLMIEEIPVGADILATGPLTRVAGLIRAGRSPLKVTWMGGALSVLGNARGGAEWNAATDARALLQVLDSKAELTVCPLDLTNQFHAEPGVVRDGAKGVTAEIRKAYGEKERYWWDELAAAFVAAPGLFQKKRIKLRGDLRGRLKESASGRMVEVLTECDRAGFRGLLERSLRF